LVGDLDRLEGKQVDQFLTDNNITTNYAKSVKIGKDTDCTHTFKITGLQANCRYYYAVIADVEHLDEIPRRTEIGYQDIKSFITLPDSPKKISFGFYSCHDPFSHVPYMEGAWPHYYSVLKDRNALFSIGGGDQMYVDTNKKEDMYDVWEWLAKNKNQIIKTYTKNGQLNHDKVVDYFTKIYRNYYRIYWNFTNVKKVFESFPQYMIWDDHEIMDGWGSYTSKERKKLLNKLFQHDDEELNSVLIDLMFMAAKKAYFEYEHSHNPYTAINFKADENQSCEWDYSFQVGDCAFYFLDMRGHHDYERPTNRLLGKAQMKRFDSWLKSSKVKSRKILIIISPVPVVHWSSTLTDTMDWGEAKDDLRDEWEHKSNHKERNMLLDKLMEVSHGRGQTVLFLSGDVHCASVYQIEKYEKFPKAKIFNATSSAISRKPAPKAAKFVMHKTGAIKNYKGGFSTRLYALAGFYNFLMVTIDTSTGNLSLQLDLYWPGGDDGEVVQKKLVLIDG